jgi:hypothetical protein
MKKFFQEYKKIRLKTPLIYWTLNISSLFLSGLFFSLFLKGDYEKLVMIGITVFGGIFLHIVFGGYKNEKQRYELKNKL